MNELFFLLLPLAAFTGWWLAKVNKPLDTKKEHDEELFKGLGFLLEDKTDEAIEIFIKVAQIDASTTSNQITLGNIFRHQGEIDRALHIHHTILDSGNIPSEVSSALYLALAEDYRAAGIINHSEDFYKKATLAGNSDYKKTAQIKLIGLYSEQGKWQDAIDLIADIDPFSHDIELQRSCAQFYCELAEEAIKNNEVSEAKGLLNKALKTDDFCFRANIILGRLAKKESAFVSAINYFQAIERQNKAFLIEVLPDIEYCYKELNQLEEWGRYLKGIEEKQIDSNITLVYAEYLKNNFSLENALIFLKEKVQKKPDISLLKNYLVLINNIKVSKEIKEKAELLDDTFNMVLSLLKKTTATSLAYQCRQCGFRGNQSIWQCPSCKTWGNFAPKSKSLIK